MTTDTVATIVIWVTAAVAAVTLVLIVLLRRWLARVLVLAVAAIMLALVLAVKAQIGAMPRDEPEALCNGRVSWFGLHLTGTKQLCAIYRTTASP